MHKIPSKFSQFGFRPWMFQGEGGGGGPNRVCFVR